MMKEGKPIFQTLCQGCVFAQEQAGKQVGCSLGRWDAYKGAGFEVGDEGGYGRIDGIRCPAYRSVFWLREGESAEDQARRVKEESRFRLHVFLSIRPEEKDAACRTMASLARQTVPIWRTTVLVNNEEGQPYLSARALVDEWNPHDWPMEWFVEEIKLGVNSREVFDGIISKDKSVYYTHFVAGWEVPPTFHEEMQDAVYDRVERFLLLLPMDTAQCNDAVMNGLTVQTLMHKEVGGYGLTQTNAEYGEEKTFSTPLEKIIWLAQKEGRTHLIKRVEDVCPCMKGVCV